MKFMIEIWNLGVQWRANWKWVLSVISPFLIEHQLFGGFWLLKGVRRSVKSDRFAIEGSSDGGRVIITTPFITCFAESISMNPSQGSMKTALETFPWKKLLKFQQAGVGAPASGSKEQWRAYASHCVPLVSLSSLLLASEERTLTRLFVPRSSAFSMDSDGGLNMRNWGYYDLARTHYESPQSHLNLRLMTTLADRSVLGGRDSALITTANGGYHQRDCGVPSSHYQMDYRRDHWNRDYKFYNIPSNPSYSVLPETTAAHHPLQMLRPPESASDERLVRAEGIASENNDGPIKKRPVGKSEKAPKTKKAKKASNGSNEGGNTSIQRPKAAKKTTEVIINGIDMDISSIPIPVCSCTGTPQQCYRWGSGGWQSACCTTSMSVYPLPMSTKRRGARIAGRKMSLGAFKKVLEKMAGEGYNFSNPIDLRTHWAKHGKPILTLKAMVGMGWKIGLLALGDRGKKGGRPPTKATSRAGTSVTENRTVTLRTAQRLLPPHSPSQFYGRRDNRFRAITMAFQGKKLINNPNDVVMEFIEGLVETYPGLQYLDGFPEVKVVLRADVSSSTYDKVAVISGGGSGHEPAHAGFVGEGMLTAVICGDVFASPPVNSILAGIRAVTGPMGCLLIVTNYTGDRLNFGLAAEQAKSEGYKIETVIVGDDCALPPSRGIAGRRGLAGTILVNKVAGAAAACGISLDDVTAEAKRASEMVGTMGVALSVCTLPGQVTSDRLGPGKMELGLGVHGEPGAAVADLLPVDMVIAHILEQILSLETNYVPITRGNNVVVMVNGLGATPMMELMIAAGIAVPKLQLEHGLAVDRVYTGSFMTSLDMAGFSISIMKVDEGILQRLDASTKAPAWPVGVDGNHPPAKIPVPVPQSPSTQSSKSTRPQQLSKQGHILEIAIQAAAAEVINLRDTLNEWDVKVGDGDFGSAMFRGATAVMEDLKYYPLNNIADTMKAIGSSIGRAMGGTSGIIYDIFFKAVCAQLKSSADSEITPKQWASAFEAAIAAVGKYGGANAGYRTMIDALIPALTIFQERLDAGNDPVDAFVHSSDAALAGAESTKRMQAKAGRSPSVSAEILSSVPDPGAVAAASWYRAAALAVKQCYQPLSS
ncbi:hypothetical protein Nepgr_019306 [Nepenthes gracilis]|uniref:3,4-dihydroxy-2-butanone kinase n=2 Tax=Magnoliopsida TaxID=3398 RepID=A0AAD3STB0_NEPGR|nr:hypothetical protein Nepgr_019306 [Nepenthes gracilis]